MIAQRRALYPGLNHVSQSRPSSGACMEVIDANPANCGIGYSLTPTHPLPPLAMVAFRFSWRLPVPPAARLAASTHRRIRNSTAVCSSRARHPVGPASRAGLRAHAHRELCVANSRPTEAGWPRSQARSGDACLLPRRGRSDPGRLETTESMHALVRIRVLKPGKLEVPAANVTVKSKECRRQGV
jgi:hypothetical protein